MENLYTNQRDYIFKYSLILACMISCFCSILQICSETERCFSCTLLNIIVMIFFIILTFIVWYNKMCWIKSKIKSSANPIYGSFSCVMFYLVKKIQISLEIRVLIYLFIEISHGTIIALIMVREKSMEGVVIAFLIRYYTLFSDIM